MPTRRRKSFGPGRHVRMQPNAALTSLVLATISFSLMANCNVTPLELDCQQQLMEQVYACVTEQDVDFNTFLVAITDEAMLSGENDTIKSPEVFESSDANDTEAFRRKVCSLQKPIMRCSFEAAKELILTPACASSADGEESSAAAFSQGLLANDQRYLIKQQLEAIVGQLDAYCAHPCRNSLLEDMRHCYKDMGLEPELFISTASGGPVIGDDRYDVDIFCNNRSSLVDCIRAVKDKCPEADLVLGTIDLDLDFMEKGFAVLCEDQEAYLQSLDCFETHTETVGLCHSVWYRNVLRISREAQDLDWSEVRYFQEVCDIKLEHIQCDLDAWGSKDDEDCDESTLALKRHLHCALIPPQCALTHKSVISSLCDSHARNKGVPITHSRPPQIMDYISLMVLYIICILYSSHL